MPLLRMRGITSVFPGTLALDEVDLAVEAGSIHGLLGENGAGKSTLLKILAGDEPDGGTIELDGRAVHQDPAEAHGHGIGIVYQELSLLPNLSVAQNVALGRAHARLAIDEPEIRSSALVASTASVSAASADRLSAAVARRRACRDRQGPDAPRGARPWSSTSRPRP